MLVYFIIAFVIASLFGVNHFLLIPAEIDKFLRLVSEKKFDEAFQVYNQSLKNSRHRPEIVYALAEIYESRQEWYLVVAQYKRLLTQGDFPPNTDEIILRLKKIEANKMIQKYEEIAEDCYAILNIDPENTIANFEIGKRLFTLKNYRAARPHLEKINNGSSKETLEILLDIEINEKNFEKAYTYIKDLKKLFYGMTTPEILYKEIQIQFSLKKYHDVVEVSEKIPEGVQPPMMVGVFVGIAFTHLSDDKQSLKWFERYLKNFLDDKSPYIQEGRYLYSDLLIKRGLSYEALIQCQFIEQAAPDFRDIKLRRKVLASVNENKVIRALFKKNNIGDVLEEVIRFEITDFFFIENRLIFNGDEISDKEWFVLSIKAVGGKVFQLFVSFNMNPFNPEDIQTVLDKIKKNININLKSLNFVFLSLFGMGIESEKILIQTFKSCSFYNQEDFINCFNNKRIHLLFD